jgi:ethanolamine utilization microcompartment shell protein EutL
MYPVRKVEFAAHTILATMDVLSTVFKAREHTAHARLVGSATSSKTFSTVSDSNIVSADFPSNTFSQPSSKSSMLEEIPMTMVQKSVQSLKGSCSTYR